MIGARITGTGMYVPPRVVTNHDLAQLMDTSDEWIVQRSGIKERRYALDHETPADLAEHAARAALDSAKIKPTDVDMLLVATLSSHAYFPGTAAFVQAKLGMGSVPSMGVQCQCTGFLYALSTARALIGVGQYKRVLVVGVELHSRALDFSTRGRDVTVLFGDGAGAVVVEASDEPERGVLGVELHSDGSHAEKLWIQFPSLAAPKFITEENVRDGLHYPKMEGRYVFKHAVAALPQVINEILSKYSLSVKDIDTFLFHQANLRINEHVATELGIPLDKCPYNIDRYGNCSAASIPILLHESLESGRIKRGDLVCMAAFGSGFTWGAALIRA